MSSGKYLCEDVVVRHALGDDRQRALDAVMSADRIALDTEFHSERGYLPELCLVQIYVEGEGIWLFDPIRDPSFDDLGPLICSKPWLVHAGRQDVLILSQRWGALPPSLLDVQLAAGLVCPEYPLGFGALLERWLNRSIDKGMALSDWTRRPLRSAQVAYASSDVRHLPDLWNILSSEVARFARESTLEQCCSEALMAWSKPPSVAERWSRLEARDRLPPVDLHVLWRLLEWREASAREENRTPTRVLSDGLAVRIARWKPATVDLLLSDRKMPRGLVRRHGRAMVEQVNAALDTFEASQPAWLPMTEAQSFRRDWLRLAGRCVGRELSCSPRLFLKESTNRRWAVDGLQSEEQLREDLGVWRAELAGGILWDVWCGRRLLSMNGLTAM